MLDLRFNRFDWDSGNSTKSHQKHGVTKEAVEAFFDGDPAVLEDHRHSGRRSNAMKTFIKRPPKAQDPLAGDLSDFISKAKWRKARFSFAAKDTTVTLRVPKALVATAKQVAKKKGIKYQSMMRDAIVDYVAKTA